MGSTTASLRARLWIAACLCLLAALVPPRGLAICLGGGHADGRAAWGVAEGEDHCPCDAESSQQGSDEEHGNDHRDLEVPALAEATRSDVDSSSLAGVFEFRALAAAVPVAPRFASPPAPRVLPPRPPPPRLPAQRCRRTVVLRI